MPDSLYRKVKCPYSIRLPVLGVLTEFASNSSEVFGAITDTYGTWSAIARSDLVSPSGAMVHVILHDVVDAGDRVAEFRYRVPDSTRLLVTSS